MAQKITYAPSIARLNGRNLAYNKAMKSDLSLLSDEDLVSHTVDGNVDAFAELMNRYEPRLHRYVTFLIRDAMAANDVVQDTFIKVYQNLQGFKKGRAFSSWIYRIAHNEAINAVKKYRREVPFGFDETSSEMAYSDRADEAIDNTILSGDVQGCVSQLATKYRDIVQLIYFEHMSYAQVSDILRIPVATVGVRLSRAKAHLKKICTEKGVRHE